VTKITLHFFLQLAIFLYSYLTVTELPTKAVETSRSEEIGND